MFLCFQEGAGTGLITETCNAFSFCKAVRGCLEANPQGRTAVSWSGRAGREDRSAQGAQSALSPQAGSTCKWKLGPREVECGEAKEEGPEAERGKP